MDRHVYICALSESACHPPTYLSVYLPVDTHRRAHADVPSSRELKGTRSYWFHLYT
jgi:hypothetical protein